MSRMPIPMPMVWPPIDVTQSLGVVPKAPVTGVPSTRDRERQPPHASSPEGSGDLHDESARPDPHLHAARLAPVAAVEFAEHLRVHPDVDLLGARHLHER